MTRHLHSDTIPLLEASLLERTIWIKKPKWTAYNYATRVLEEIALIVQQPPSHRMPSLLLVGPSNNGKTMILERALKAHPDTTYSRNEADIVPLVFVTMPPKPDVRRFYNLILGHLHALYKPSAATAVLENQVLALLKNVGTRALIIDEFHNVIGGGYRTQLEFQNTIRFLSNELRMSIIAAGTSTAARVIKSDKQLVSRFRLCNLPLWTDGKEYRKLLFLIEGLLPLPEPTDLYKDDDLASMILSVGEQNLGDMVDFINEAATIAIKQNAPKLTMKHFKQTARTYIVPSRRADELAAVLRADNA